MLAVAEQFLAQNIHPTVIIREYRQALEDAVKLLQDKISIPIDLNDRDKLKEVVSIVYIIFSFKFTWLGVKCICQGRLNHTNDILHPCQGVTERTGWVFSQ